MAVQILFRRGSSTDWTNANPVLGAGEPGVETNTGKIKVGDGTTAWTALPYAAGLESLRLQDLADVASTAPTTGQALVWSGTTWAPATVSGGGGSDGNTTYSVFASAATGGANITLAGSDSSLDNLKLAEGANVTIVQTDVDTITISSTGTSGASDLNGLSDVVIDGTPNDGDVLKYNASTSLWSSSPEAATSIVNDVVPLLGGDLDVNGFSLISKLGGHITLAPGGAGTVRVADKPLDLVRNTSNTTGQLLITASNTQNQTGIAFRRTRGTYETPTIVNTNDVLGRITFTGYDGAAYSTGAYISSEVTNTPASTDVRSNLNFYIKTGAGAGFTGVTNVAKIDSTGVKTNAVSALTTNSNLTLSGNGTGTVVLPAGTTIGGVVAGSISINGTVANEAALPGQPVAAGTAYIVLSPSPTHLWASTGSAWVDLGTFQGPAGDNGTNGTNGQGVPTGGTTGQILSKIDGTDYNTTWVNAPTGGGGAMTRSTASNTTGVLADGASGDLTITGFKSYALLKMFVDQAAWVRVYTDVASQGADSSRAEGVDPAPGSGVIAEIITTGADTILISPAAIGFNNELTPTTDIPVTVTNKSGVSTTVTVSLTLLQLEA